MDKIITIDSSRFSSLETFYIEIDNTLTKNLDWETGHNLDALSDILRGGFGVYGYEEQIKMIWLDIKKAKSDLGQESAQKILEIIKSHRHIDLILD
ncbi:MAG TPA: barstar family protein [Ferruginibacter sp.]|jgi:RNAse (barnase) inhibitor barstar|nr:barstar family protein [Ferruginibacter sp.]